MEALPYGVSLHLEAASLSKQTTSLCRFISSNTDSIFHGAESWVISEIINEEDDAQKLVLANQKRLQESFGSKSVTSTDANNVTAAFVSKSNINLSEDNISLSLQLLDCIEQSKFNLHKFEALSEIPNVNIDFSASKYKPIHSVDDLVSPLTFDLPPTSAAHKYISPNAQTGAVVISFGLGDNNDNELSTGLKDSKSVHKISSKLPNGDRNVAGESLEKLLEADIAEMDSLISASGICLGLNEAATSLSELPQVTTTKDADSIPSAISGSFGEHRIVSINESKYNSEESELESLLQGIAGIISTTKETQKIVENAPALWASTERLSVAEYDSLRPRMAMSFSFELDDFQKQSVMRLERRECVFVSAHTSAGKTVIAEYAIALANKHMTRAIYTSPIKALSNQKFRDLRERFGEDAVGLITGDISVNPNAGCLVMTTEILRSMLYRGSDTVRDIEYVIFDEVHYVNDAERGVVWEEVIIMLPERVHLVFLSATTPNVMEFSDWIGRTKRRKVYVIGTLKRPVPLQHFLLYRDEVFTLMPAGGTFRSGIIGEVVSRMKERDKPKAPTAENALMKNDRQLEKLALASQRAGKQLTATAASGKVTHSAGSAAGRGGSHAVVGSKAEWIKLVNLLKSGGREAAGGVKAVDFGTGYNERVLSVAARKEKDTFVPYERLPADMRKSMSKHEYDSLQVRGSEDETEQESDGGLLPAIIFCFSKKKCEDIADHLKGMNLITHKEKAEVKRIIGMALSRLSALDCQLPQVKKIAEMLSRGIGVHHGGLLPVLKECVELLFAQSVVKILIATETFAMGVNMPAKSVVYNGFRKHDGKSFRELLPGEYVQMAGRAGRRGKDKVGTVIIAQWGEQLPMEQTFSKLLTGTATKLNSKFRLTYSMILNLLRSGDLRVEDMIKRSFTEFHTQKALQSVSLGFKMKEWEHDSLILQQQLSRELCHHGECPIEEFAGLYNACRQQQMSLLNHLSAEIPNFTEFLRSKLLSAGRVVLTHQNGATTKNIRIGSPCLAIALINPNIDGESMKPSDTGVGAAATAVAANSKDDVLFTNHSIWLLILLPPETGPIDIVSPESSLKVSTEKEMREKAVSAKLDGMFTVKRKDDFDDLSFGVGKNKKQSSSASSSAAVVKELNWVEASNTCDILGMKRTYAILKLPVSEIVLILSEKVQCPISTNSSDIQTSLEALASLEFSTLNICTDLKPKTSKLEIAEGNQALSSIVKAINESCCKQCDLLGRRFFLADSIRRLHSKHAYWKHQHSNDNLSLFPDFKQRLSLLLRLGYLEQSSSDSDSGTAQEGHVVSLKGRVACEMNSCDELLAAEIIFDNILESLNPPEAVALLSALIFREKTEDNPLLTTRMEVARERCMQIQDALDILSTSVGLVPSDEVDDGKSGKLNFGLCAVVYQWARGVPFKEITEMTAVQEGTIVRTITRLDELCRDFRNAARVVGNPSLFRKMEAASACIKRDVVFAASLYIN